MKKDFIDLLKEITKPDGSIDLRDLSGHGKLHDVTHGPCCCGAWHKGEIEFKEEA